MYGGSSYHPVVAVSKLHGDCGTKRHDDDDDEYNDDDSVQFLFLYVQT
jgi:hypothetical protein